MTDGIAYVVLEVDASKYEVWRAICTRPARAERIATDIRATEPLSEVKVITWNLDTLSGRRMRDAHWVAAIRSTRTGEWEMHISRPGRVDELEPPESVRVGRYEGMRVTARIDVWAATEQQAVKALQAAITRYENEGSKP